MIMNLFPTSLLLLLLLQLQQQLLSAGAVLTAGGSATHVPATDDVTVVADRLLERLLVAAAPAKAHGDAATLLADGSWADVRYNDTSRTGSWSPHVHLQRMQNMAAVVRATNDSSLALATNHAVEFWLHRDPRSLNWYLALRTIYV